MQRNANSDRRAAGQWQGIQVAGLSSHLSQLGFMAQRAVPAPFQDPRRNRRSGRPQELWSRLSLLVTVVGQAKGEIMGTGFRQTNIEHVSGEKLRQRSEIL